MAEQQHRATARQWRDAKALAYDIVTYSCLLELRDRIEALESAAKPTQPNHPEKPDSSLVERVAAAMHPTIYAGPPYLPSPRAVIREVAAWLWEQERYVLDWAAVTLEEEAKHRST
jgi:hypothetical protein